MIFFLSPPIFTFLSFSERGKTGVYNRVKRRKMDSNQSMHQTAYAVLQPLVMVSVKERQ
jgi:hypothetical protein